MKFVSEKISSLLLTFSHVLFISVFLSFLGLFDFCRADKPQNSNDSINALKFFSSDGKQRKMRSDIGIIRTPYANVRRFPNPNAELVTQALFMDGCRILKKKGKWFEVNIIAQKGYYGWVHDKLIETPIFEVESLGIQLETLIVTSPYAVIRKIKQNHEDTMLQVPIGTYLQAYAFDSGQAKVLLPTGEGQIRLKNCVFLDSLRVLSIDSIRNSIIFWARSFLGTPYLWGGTTTKGLDCSGLVYLCYRMIGFILDRDGIPQYNAGIKIDTTKLIPGDLVYFSTYKKGASHTGIYVGQRRFIQASNTKGVVETALDEKYWKERFYGAATYFPNVECRRANEIITEQILLDTIKIIRHFEVKKGDNLISLLNHAGVAPQKVIVAMKEAGFDFTRMMLGDTLSLYFLQKNLISLRYHRKSKIICQLDLSSTKTPVIDTQQTKKNYR